MTFATRSLLLALPLAFGMMACGSSDVDLDAVEGDGADDTATSDDPVQRGMAVYSQSLPGGNTFACGTCHALEEPVSDGIRRPGHPFDDVLNRPSYKSGNLDEFVDAANSCRADWMGIEEPWTEDSEEYTDLVAFLEEEIGTDDGEALEFTIIAPPPPMAELMGGSMAEGEDVFNETCAVCHGEGASGSELAPALVGEFLDVDLIARRVRTSGSPDSVAYEGAGLTGGRMPFWSEERLSAEELQDVIAFVLNNDGRTDAVVESDTASDGVVGECDSTHPSVGQTAELSNRSHGISGTVEVLNDCTIQITNFNFDGGGINVRIFGGVDGNYDGGIDLNGENLVRRNPYLDETLTLQLPNGVTLDDFNGVSVWCVPIGIDFGSGVFE